MSNEVLMAGDTVKPEPKWDECDQAEKIERLRREMLDFRYTLNRIVELETKVSHLQKHSHVEGQVVIGISSANNRSSLSASRILDPLR